MPLAASIPLAPVTSGTPDLNINASVIGSEPVSGTGTQYPSRNGGYARAFFVGVAGTVTYTLASSSSTDSTANLAAGVWHSMAVTSVVVSSGTTTITTATDLKFGY
jgi:hypothetical protein